MTEPAWARGIDMAFLKACAAVFKADLKPHCYGAFGLPKERDVADAHAAGELLWTREGDQIAACAIFRQLKAGSQHQDFAGRTASIAKGELFIRQIAGSPDGRAKLMAHLIERGGPVIWAEIHVENGELTALLEASGFEWQMSKIAASSDIKGLYARGLPARRAPKALGGADIPALAIMQPDFITPADQAAMLAEADQFAEWAQHYSGYNKRQSWTAFALRGFDAADPGFIIKPDEMSKQWKADNPQRMGVACADTAAVAHFPATMGVVDRIPGAKQRVRLMRLASGGGELTRHADITDPEAGTADRRVSRLHIPLRSSAQCMFRGWDLHGGEHRIHFPERALCYLDTRKPHAVINPGRADRVHLVIDCYSSNELRPLIAGAVESGAVAA